MEADKFHRIMSLVKNLPTQLWETKEENRTTKSIDEKPRNRWGELGKKTKRS